MPVSGEHDRRPLIIAAMAIVALTGVRLALAARLGLAPDEAYYWQWSASLSLTYPDHPPLVAWLVRLGTVIAGETSLGVRLPFVLSGAIAPFFVYSIGRALGLDGRASAVSAVLSSLLPAPAVASLLATPDTPLGLCWLAAALALARLARGPAPGSWYLLGVALGLGLLAKHSALLLALSVALAVLLAPRIRSDLRTAHPWLALLLALVLCGPELGAELAADGSALALQLRHLAGAMPSGAPAGPVAVPLRLAALIAGQIGLLTPLVTFLAALLAFRRRPLPVGWRLALALLLLPMAATAIAALFVHPEQNWAAVGHPLAAVLAVGAIAPPFHTRRLGRARVWLAATLLTAGCAMALLHWHAARPFLPLPAERDPVSRLHGWDDLAALGADLRAADAAVCDNYGLAAELAWHARRPGSAPPIIGQDRAPDPPAGDWLLLDELEDWSGASLAVDCRQIDPLGVRTQTRADGRPVRRIVVSHGRGCRPAESPEPTAR